MDLGCYVLSAARHFGHWIGISPEIVSVEADLKAPELDSAMRVSLSYSGGITGSAVWDMDAADRTMTWTVFGSRGSASSLAFGVPHLDPRLEVTIDGRTMIENFAGTSYTYQLAALARTLQDGDPFLVDIDDAVANAELIDEVYRRAGLTPRGL